MTDLSYNEIKQLYSDNFSLGYLNTDINTKFALISLLGYLVFKLKKKKSDITPYQVIKKIKNLPEDFVKGLSVVVEDFSYGCTNFPTFGIEDKKIPLKIREILNMYIPF